MTWLERHHKDLVRVINAKDHPLWAQVQARARGVRRQRDRRHEKYIQLVENQRHYTPDFWNGVVVPYLRGRDGVDNLSTTMLDELAKLAQWARARDISPTQQFQLIARQLVLRREGHLGYRSSQRTPVPKDLWGISSAKDNRPLVGLRNDPITPERVQALSTREAPYFCDAFGLVWDAEPPPEAIILLQRHRVVGARPSVEEVEDAPRRAAREPPQGRSTGLGSRSGPARSTQRPTRKKSKVGRASIERGGDGDRHRGNEERRDEGEGRDGGGSNDGRDDGPVQKTAPVLGNQDSADVNSLPACPVARASALEQWIWRQACQRAQVIVGQPRIDISPTEFEFRSGEPFLITWPDMNHALARLLRVYRPRHDLDIAVLLYLQSWRDAADLIGDQARQTRPATQRIFSTFAAWHQRWGYDPIPVVGSGPFRVALRACDLLFLLPPDGIDADPHLGAHGQLPAAVVEAALQLRARPGKELVIPVDEYHRWETNNRAMPVEAPLGPASPDIEVVLVPVISHRSVPTWSLLILRPGRTAAYFGCQRTVSRWRPLLMDWGAALLQTLWPRHSAFSRSIQSLPYPTSPDNGADGGVSVILAGWRAMGDTRDVDDLSHPEFRAFLAEWIFEVTRSRETD